LRAKGAEVTIFCQRQGPRKKEEYVEGVRIVRFSRQFDRKVLGLPNKLRNLFLTHKVPHDHAWYFHLLYILRIAHRIRREGFDLIHLVQHPEFAPWLRLLNPHSKIVWSVHAVLYTYLLEGHMESWGRSVDGIVTVSRFVAETLQKQFPSLAPKCQVRYNAVDTEVFKPLPEKDVEEVRARFSIKGEKVVLFAGKLTPEKGLHVLIHAMKRVIRQYPHVKLLIAGKFVILPPNPRAYLFPQTGEAERLKKNYPGFLKELAEDIQEHVTFAGFIPHQELASLYNLADLFVHPVLCEDAFPNAVLEAMACEVPVIASRTGGIPESVVEGQTGLLINPGDEGMLAEAMMRLLQDEGLRRKMGKEGRRRVAQRFNLERSTEVLFNLYQSILRPACPIKAEGGEDKAVEIR